MEELKCNKCGMVGLPKITVKKVHHIGRCAVCNAYIKHIGHAEPQFYCGKYKGKPIAEIDDLEYLYWANENMKMSKYCLDALESRIDELEGC